MKFYDCIEKNKDKNISIYCDMDGVIAEYDIDNFDYENRRPITSTIKKIKDLYKEDNISIYILSICKTNNIVYDKITWFKKQVFETMGDEKNEELIFIWVNYFINNTSYIIFTKFCCT